MKDEDVKFGMKVVPHNKSVMDSLKNSQKWKECKAKNQEFMFVAEYDNDENAWVLMSKYPELDQLGDYGSYYDGDFFLASDFEPYLEKNATYKIILSGFETKDQAKKFLEWYEGIGEQDESISYIMGDNISTVLTNVEFGMIEHNDGWEYKINIYKNE